MACSMPKQKFLSGFYTVWKLLDKKKSKIISGNTFVWKSDIEVGVYFNTKIDLWFIKKEGRPFRCVASPNCSLNSFASPFVRSNTNTFFKRCDKDLSISHNTTGIGACSFYDRVNCDIDIFVIYGDLKSYLGHQIRDHLLSPDYIFFCHLLAMT